MKTLKLMRSAARVERMHTDQYARPQSVGEHTFGALAILHHVYPQAPLQLWHAVLYHDAAEVITGDVPATAKWRFPGLRAALELAETEIEHDHNIGGYHLTAEEKRVLRFCDVMELAIYSIEEAERGNDKAVTVARKCIDHMSEHELWNVSLKATNLWNYVTGHFEIKYSEQPGVLFGD